MTENSKDLVIGKVVEKRIFLIRGQKVMLDGDLADLYGVSTGNFNKGIRRNLKRFPDDFMFQLSEIEWNSLRSQVVISKVGRGGRRHLPYAFTESGVAMLSSVLNSVEAIQTNLIIIRTFIRMRSLLAKETAVLSRLDALERNVSSHNVEIRKIFGTIREMLTLESNPKRPIGIRRK